ncbi:kinase-like protein [Xylariaceae sp. FL1019]|nr:kinase-like protein [Xylariaceae sp. FL1019]
MASSPSSSDEGEIVENTVGHSKANDLPQINGSGVDRIDRTRDEYSRTTTKSPEYSTSSRHDIPTARRSRSPRGMKRPRDNRDAHHDRDAHRDSHRNGRADVDPRRFRVHYEDLRDSRSSRLSYDDQDRPAPRSSHAGLHYDDRDRDYGRDRYRDRSPDRDHDRYPQKSARNRTRSPYASSRRDRGRGDDSRRDNDRMRRGPDRDNVENVRSIHYHNGQRSSQRSPNASKQTSTVKSIDTPMARAEPVEGRSGDKTAKRAEDNANGTSYEEEKPVDVEAELARRRRRREELLAKSRGATPLLVRALQSSENASGSSTIPTKENTPVATGAATPQSAVWSPHSPALQDGMSPASIEIAKDQNLINTRTSGRDDEDGPSAADYDPTADMREDELRDERRNGHIGPHGEVLQPHEKAEIAPTGEDTNVQTGEANDDNEFDMFAEDFDEDKFVAPKPDHLDPVADDRKVPAALLQPQAGGILEGDDKDGYYKIRTGEIMNGRYQVQSTLGKGMFSGVARAVDITNKRLVAIKMMRNNDALRKGGFTEIAILQKLNDADPDSRKHIVKFERHFEHKGHLCLAFENLSLNLREVLRKFGNNIGINISATRTYAHQIFVALAHLRKCSIIHADLKPDNILVNENRSTLKICDLGTAIDRSDAATAHTEITPYLVSRFYRAPEIILGMPYDYAVDMWSIGCTLYELYTGKILFAGDSNNQMLKAIMEIRGKFSAKLYKRGELSHLHFDDLGNFVSAERDKTLGKITMRTMAIVKPTRDLRTRLLGASGGMSDAESRDLNHFVDLLERCLALNPDKRVTPSEALKHPFFTSRSNGSIR